MSPDQALCYVRQHGIVLEAARGAVPSLAEIIVGGRIKGSWWSHPRGKEIFAATRAVRECSDVLVCRLVAGKITFVHRRLWPALVCIARQLPRENIAALVEEHTSTGRHVTHTHPFPEWVPRSVGVEARKLTKEAAMAIFQAAAPGVFRAD